MARAVTSPTAGGQGRLGQVDLVAPGAHDLDSHEQRKMY